MATLDYALFDADTHYYEPDDCFTRHIEARFKERTVWIDRGRTAAPVPGACTSAASAASSSASAPATASARRAS